MSGLKNTADVELGINQHLGSNNMKVKIGKYIFNSEDQPIMVILSEEDKNNIKNMADNATKYCSYPDDGFDEKCIIDFMRADD